MTRWGGWRQVNDGVGGWRQVNDGVGGGDRSMTGGGVETGQ